MHYFIDGYNLLFRMNCVGDNLKNQREYFFSEFQKKILLLDIDATLVFDAHYKEGEGSRTHCGSLEICFTDYGETADDYILKRIQAASHPKQETVVTSDKKLAREARNLSAKTESVDVFLTRLNKRYHESSLKKEPRQPTLKPTIQEKNLKKIESDPPKFGSDPLDSFEYYLYHFEKKYTSKTLEIKKQEIIETDFERWKRIFESKDEE